jgi:pimeloyl-ACP methyl ester carboxylesterase
MTILFQRYSRKYFFKIFFFLISFFLFFINNAFAKNCHKEDFVNFVSDAVGCIAINIHQEEKFSENVGNKNKLVFFIHGDQLNSKVTYFNDFASNFITSNAFIISITRPGWTNIKDHKSEGKKNISNGDNYVPKVDVDPIYRVIKKLKKKYQLNNTLVVGHSGGAAIAGILSGRFPNLIDEAILISCPCIVPPWRKNYFDQISKKSNSRYCSPVFKSHSPHEYIKRIDPKLKTKIFIGNLDQNTLPVFSATYHKLLLENNKKSEILYFEGNHISVLDNKKLKKIVEKIINS